MEKTKEDKLREKLEQPTGKVPASDKKTFLLLFNTIVDTYQLDGAVDQMAASRMAACLMKIRYCETLIKKHGLVLFEEENPERVQKMNPLAYYMRDLETEFLTYMKALQRKSRGYTKAEKTSTPQDFFDMITKVENKQ